MLGSTRTYGPSGVPVTVAIEPVGCCAKTSCVLGTTNPKRIAAQAINSTSENLPSLAIIYFRKIIEATSPIVPNNTRPTTKIPGATMVSRGVLTSVNCGTVKGGGGVKVGKRVAVG